MKPKKSYKPGPMDNCMTPPYALDPIMPFLEKGWMWWEPAMGTGNIVRTLRKHRYKIRGTDVVAGYGYFNWRPNSAAWDASITNPPYGLKYKWLSRSVELDKPFALLVPVEMLGAKKCQEWLKKIPFEIMLLNRRINFIMPK